MTSGGPVPGKAFLGEVDKGLSEIEVVGNEVTIEVGKAKEGSYVLDFHRHQPAGDPA